MSYKEIQIGLENHKKAQCCDRIFYKNPPSPLPLHPYFPQKKLSQILIKSCQNFATSAILYYIIIIDVHLKKEILQAQRAEKPYL
jgi:hypothetical protein